MNGTLEVVDLTQEAVSELRCTARTHDLERDGKKLECGIKAVALLGSRCCPGESCYICEPLLLKTEQGMRERHTCSVCRNKISNCWVVTPL